MVDIKILDKDFIIAGPLKGSNTVTILASDFDALTKSQERAGKLEEENEFLWRWARRFVFGELSVEECKSVIKHYPGAPWKNEKALKKEQG